MHENVSERLSLEGLWSPVDHAGALVENYFSGLLTTTGSMRTAVVRYREGRNSEGEWGGVVSITKTPDYILR